MDIQLIILVLFIGGYLAITLEHTLKVDKLIPALGMMALLWAIIALNQLQVFNVNAELKQLEPTHLEAILLHHLGKTAEILIFLIGAMTIVEIIDYFDGFATIKGFIRTKSKVRLLWIFAVLGFILSAIIDNLTATIVLITILQKVIKDRDTRLWFAGLIVIAANAGGAWSPIGDVTTTMLWIANKVTTWQLVEHTFIPSVICMVIPILIASRFKVFSGEIEMDEIEIKEEASSSKYGSTMLYLGLSAIIFVPIFKTATHLPPYIGMMLSLAIVATFAEIYSHRLFNLSRVGEDQDASDAASHHSPVHKSLGRVEMPSILFFLGILMAVAALESLGMLFNFAIDLDHAIPNRDLVVGILGIGSAIIDNVPLVAASIGMFSEPMDHPLWHFIAYAAGTGGSILIIGSAAGVVAMGMEKINFFWYLKKIGILAFLGFAAGGIAFILMRDLVLNA